MTKVCSKCKGEKDVYSFFRSREAKDGRKSQCKDCIKEYRKKNREEIKEYQKEYHERKKDEIKECQKNYYCKYRKRINAKKKAYKDKNRDRWKKYNREYVKNKYQNDPQMMIAARLRARIYAAITRKNIKKQYHLNEVLGCTIKELKIHLEKQFKEGMTWNNYGAWHIDHIIPCSAFDLTDIKEQKRCFHFTNLQPLTKEANLKKHAKIDQRMKIAV